MTPCAPTTRCSRLGRHCSRRSAGTARPCGTAQIAGGACGPPPRSALPRPLPQSLCSREFRLVSPPPSLLEPQAEMWPSGRRHTPAKGADGEPSRGFESLRLRQNHHKPLYTNTISYHVTEMPPKSPATARDTLPDAEALNGSGSANLRSPHRYLARGHGHRFQQGGFTSLKPAAQEVDRCI